MLRKKSMYKYELRFLYMFFNFALSLKELTFYINNIKTK